jgi:transketolase
MKNDLGPALVEYGQTNQDVVVLDADLSQGTMTCLFQQAFPERFFNVGIAEAGLIDTAVGLAMGGKIPFASTFAATLYRAVEQIRTCVAYNNANVKILANYAGICDFKDGPTHHSLFDLAIMRAMPNMTVVAAADGTELRTLIPLVGEYPGPVYLRISRTAPPPISQRDEPVVIGKGRTLRNGTDVTLVTMGILLVRTLEAHQQLLDEGISARVVEMHTLKPFDADLILRCAEETRGIVTIEEHSVIGGLYGAVAETLSSTHPTPVIPIGIPDRFARTAPDADSLLDCCGIAVSNIIEAAKAVIKKKKI